MLRCALWVGLVAGLTVCLSPACPADDKNADDKKAWQEAELKKLAGRWTTLREKKIDQDKVRQRRVDLEFTEGRLEVFVFDEKDNKVWDGGLKVISAEQVGRGLGVSSRLKLDRGEIYYDLVEEKLIIVGRIGPRPWEGYPLSGEYRRRT